jgi:hypothetical protein
VAQALERAVVVSRMWAKRAECVGGGLHGACGLPRGIGRTI